jgi:hypothetical protein
MAVATDDLLMKAKAKAKATVDAAKAKVKLSVEKAKAKTVVAIEKAKEKAKKSTDKTKAKAVVDAAKAKAKATIAAVKAKGAIAVEKAKAKAKKYIDDAKMKQKLRKQKGGEEGPPFQPHAPEQCDVEVLMSLDKEGVAFRKELFEIVNNPYLKETDTNIASEIIKKINEKTGHKREDINLAVLINYIRTRIQSRLNVDTTANYVQIVAALNESLDAVYNIIHTVRTFIKCDNATKIICLALLEYIFEDFMLNKNNCVNSSTYDNIIEKNEDRFSKLQFLPKNATIIDVIQNIRKCDNI